MLPSPPAYAWTPILSPAKLKLKQREVGGDRGNYYASGGVYWQTRMIGRFMLRKIYWISRALQLPQSALGSGPV